MERPVMQHYRSLKVMQCRVILGALLTVAILRRVCASVCRRWNDLLAPPSRIWNSVDIHACCRPKAPGSNIVPFLQRHTSRASHISTAR